MTSYHWPASVVILIKSNQFPSQHPAARTHQQSPPLALALLFRRMIILAGVTPSLSLLPPPRYQTQTILQHSQSTNIPLLYLLLCYWYNLLVTESVTTNYSSWLLINYNCHWLDLGSR